jgi:hypothetical protein
MICPNVILVNISFFKKKFKIILCTLGYVLLHQLGNMWTNPRLNLESDVWCVLQLVECKIEFLW